MVFRAVVRGPDTDRVFGGPGRAARGPPVRAAEGAGA